MNKEDMNLYKMYMKDLKENIVKSTKTLNFFVMELKRTEKDFARKKPFKCNTDIRESD